MSRVLLVVVLVACGSTRPPPVQPVSSPVGPRPGQLDISVRYENGTVHYVATGRGVDLATLPAAEWVLVPMIGKADVAVDVVVPVLEGRRDWSRANGSLEVHCAPCQLGDDKAKIRTGSRFVGDIPFGHFTLEGVDIAATIVNGSATITRWDVKSPDLRVVLALQIALASELDDSVVEGCVRFDALDLLKERDQQTDAILAMMGAARGPDGLFNIRLAGRFGALKRLAQVCDGSAPLAAVPTDDPPAHPGLPPDPDAPAVDPDAEALLDAINAGIKKLDDITYDVDLSLVAKVMANPMAVLKGARVVPAMKNGKPDGFKLYAIRPSSIFAKLGFGNGDTVQTVNGASVESVEQAFAVYSGLADAKAGTTIVVGIVRRGKPVTLTYRLR